MSILFRLPLRPFLPKPARAAKGRVLLVRDDVIGDLVVPTSVVVKWLLEQKYDVYLVLRKEFLDIGKLFLPAEKLIALDIKSYRSSLKYRFNFLKNIRNMVFEIAIGSLMHSSVNDDIVRCGGATARWGYKGHKRSSALEENIRLRGIRKVETLSVLENGKQEYVSVVEHERHFLEAIFNTKIASGTFAPALNVPAARPDYLPPKYLHYLVEAGAVKRVFPPERLLPVLLPLARKAGLKIVLTGLKKIDTEKIKLDGELCFNLTGQTALAEVISIVNNAEFVIGNESGLVHLAWIIGKKTAMFFGGGHWGRFRPTSDVLLLNMPCAYNCCDWKCRYDSIPVPCVSLDDALLQSRLESFITGE